MYKKEPKMQKNKLTAILMLMIVFVTISHPTLAARTGATLLEGERKQVELTEEGTFIKIELTESSEYEFKLYPEFYEEVKHPDYLDEQTVYPYFAVTKKNQKKDDYKIVEPNNGYFTEDYGDEVGDTFYYIDSDIYISNLRKGTYYLYVAARIPRDVGAVVEVGYENVHVPYSMETGTKIFVFLVIGGIILFVLFAMAQRRKKIQEYGSIENWKEEYYKKFVEQNNPSAVTNACPNCGNTQHAEGVSFCSKCGHKLK